MSIRGDNLVWKIGSRTIIDGVSFAVEPGKTLGLLGPNGSGKTSLLRLLAGLKRPHAGRVTLEGEDIARIRRRTIAQRIAFIEQHATTNANLKVLDVVKLGRFPHRSLFSGWTCADDAAVNQALDRTEMTAKRDQSWQTLSGGEKQRAHLARALAQAPQELILDEPTNHLDVHHQISLLRLVSELSLTSVIALHDLNHAAMFCDRLIVLKLGRIIEPGKPVQNAFVESLNGKLRDGRLNLHWFRSLRHAREEIERWRRRYNTERPHSALGYRTPMEVLTAYAAPALEPLAGSALPLNAKFNPEDSSSPRP